MTARSPNRPREPELGKKEVWKRDGGIKTREKLIAKMTDEDELKRPETKIIGGKLNATDATATPLLCLNRGSEKRKENHNPSVYYTLRLDLQNVSPVVVPAVSAGRRSSDGQRKV